MPAGSTSLQWTATVIRFSIMLAGPAVGLPVEVPPEDIDAVDDAAELEGAVGRVDGAPARITREQDATFLQELAHGRDPEGQRRDLGIRSERAGGLVSAEPMAAREAAGHRIVRVHLPAGKGVVPGEELHA